MGSWIDLGKEEAGWKTETGKDPRQANSWCSRSFQRILSWRTPVINTRELGGTRQGPVDAHIPALPTNTGGKVWTLQLHSRNENVYLSYRLDSLLPVFPPKPSRVLSVFVR